MSLFPVLAKIIRVFYVKTRVSGVGGALGKPYSIFIANHLDSFGPLAIMCTLIHKLHPWVTHEVMNAKKCAAYIRKDFIEKELKIRSFFARELAAVLGRICVSLMSYLKAIPVYKHSKQLLRTFEMSIDFLKAGKALLIFAEDEASKERDDLCILDTGFVRVAQWLYAKTRKIATFYPVTVNRHVRKVEVGPPIRFDPGIPFREERRRIKREMERRMNQMYRELENADAASHLKAYRKSGKKRMLKAS